MSWLLFDGKKKFVISITTSFSANNIFESIVHAAFEFNNRTGKKY